MSRPGRPEDPIPRYGPQGDYVAIYIRKLHVTWDEFQTTIGERVGEPDPDTLVPPGSA